MRRDCVIAASRLFAAITLGTLIFTADGCGSDSAAGAPKLSADEEKVVGRWKLAGMPLGSRPGADPVRDILGGLTLEFGADHTFTQSFGDAVTGSQTGTLTRDINGTWSMTGAEIVVTPTTFSGMQADTMKSEMNHGSEKYNSEAFDPITFKLRVDGTTLTQLPKGGGKSHGIDFVRDAAK